MPASAETLSLPPPRSCAALPALLARVFAALLCLLVAPLAAAQGMLEKYQAGVHYFPIVPAQPTASGDKVEVVEVFSYGCIHCANFEPMVKAWLAKKPAGAAFSYLPATFRQDFAMLARLFYATELLGIREKTHDALFKAIFEERRPFHTMADIVAFLAETGGVPADKLAAAAESFEVEAKLTRATNLIQAYGVDGTPSIVVAGKYRVTGESAAGYQNVFDVVDFLVAKELAAKKS